MDLVQVDWWDAEGDGEWQDHDDVNSWAEESPMLVSSVGFLLLDCDTHVVLVQSNSGNQIRSPFKVPRGCIKTITYLARAEYEM